MFDNLKFEWFHDGEAPMISWDLREGEIAAVMKAINAGEIRYSHFFDADIIPDCLAGEIYFAGKRHIVYTQEIGDTFNETTARRWTFTLQDVAPR